nr:hypothetical protein [Treponema primitia]
MSFCFIPFLWSLDAQENKPVIQLMPFTIEGLGLEESRFIEALIQSYVGDIGELEMRFTTPDYIISGSIILDQDSPILSLDIIKTSTGERAYYKSTYKTTTDLALKARSLVETAFSMTNPSPAVGMGPSAHEEAPQTEIPQETLSEGKILGTWRGDTGVEIVRLQPGGTGRAILSSGVQMSLVYRIDGNTLKVTQNSPNTERFYYPIPFDIARELKAQAEPWQWELFLYEEGTVLRGIKTSTEVEYEDNRIIELRPGSIREAEWTKPTR